MKRNSLYESGYNMGKTGLRLRPLDSRLTPIERAEYKAGFAAGLKRKIGRK